MLRVEKHPSGNLNLTLPISRSQYQLPDSIPLPAPNLSPQIQCHFPLPPAHKPTRSQSHLVNIPSQPLPGQPPPPTRSQSHPLPITPGQPPAPSLSLPAPTPCPLSFPLPSSHITSSKMNFTGTYLSERYLLGKVIYSTAKQTRTPI